MTPTEPSGRKYPRHSRDDVVAAAMRILDEYGLPDLTMRRLATTLDIQPSALYWHVANKQTLLALIADRIIARAVPVEETGGWKDIVGKQASALRDALLAYRDGAEVVSSTYALGLGADNAVEVFAHSISRGGFGPRESTIAANTFLHFILGHVSHEQQRLQADALGVVSDSRTADPGAVGVRDTDPNPFDFGMALLLDGLEVRSAQTWEYSAR